MQADLDEDEADFEEVDDDAEDPEIMEAMVRRSFTNGRAGYYSGTVNFVTPLIWMFVMTISLKSCIAFWCHHTLQSVLSFE